LITQTNPRIVTHE